MLYVAGRAGRSSSRGSSTENATSSANPFIRQGSLKAAREEMDRLRAEEEEKERQKAEKRVKSAQKKVRAHCPCRLYCRAVIICCTLACKMYWLTLIHVYCLL